MAERRVPRIRFKGFEEDWEQRKLGELAFITTGKLDANAAKKDGEYNFFTCGKEILKTNSYAFDGEAILINGNGDLGYTRKYVGKFNAYQRTYVLQGFVMDYEYIEHAIHKFLPDRIKNESIGGAMPYIKIDSLMNLELPIPVVQEAVAVTRFLNELDSLLSLHQRKLEKLKILKKAMLEKMFPKNGAKVPEIRFSGFTDDWEQRKLGEICSELRSGEFISAEDITEYGAIPVYGGNGLRGYTSKYNREGEFALIGRQGALCGNMNFSRGKAYFTEHAVITQANSDNDTLFLFYCCDNMNLGQYSDQSAQPGLAVGKLAQLLVRRPCKIEQEKIAKAMSVLDSLLSLHQRKLEKLRQIKKSMLERMFV